MQLNLLAILALPSLGIAVPFTHKDGQVISNQVALERGCSAPAPATLMASLETLVLLTCKSSSVPYPYGLIAWYEQPSVAFHGLPPRDQCVPNGNLVEWTWPQSTVDRCYVVGKNVRVDLRTPGGQPQFPGSRAGNAVFGDKVLSCWRDSDQMLFYSGDFGECYSWGYCWDSPQPYPHITSEEASKSDHSGDLENFFQAFEGLERTPTTGHGSHSGHKVVVQVDAEVEI